MSDRKKGYLGLFFVLIVFLAIIFIFNLPKVTILTILGVVVIFNILVFEIFIFRKW